jgi:hypothetical protein
MLAEPLVFSVLPPRPRPRPSVSSWALAATLVVTASLATLDGCGVQPSSQQPKYTGETYDGPMAPAAGQFLYMGPHGARQYDENGGPLSDDRGVVLGADCAAAMTTNPGVTDTLPNQSLCGNVTAEAARYYATAVANLGNQAAPDISTFAKWKALFGFSPRGSNETLQEWRDRTDVIIYYNENGLGLGRELGCSPFTDTNNQTGYACFVTNYGQSFGDLVDALTDAVNGVRVKNTVCIMYRPSFATQPGPGYEIQFFVFGSGDSDSSQLLQNWAALDDFGPRLVPQICTNCHGGQYDPSKHLTGPTPALPEATSFPLPRARGGFATQPGGKFLPMNPFAMKFADTAVDSLGLGLSTLNGGTSPPILSSQPVAPGVTLAGQQERIRKLNAIARETSLMPAQINMVDALYGFTDGVENVTIPNSQIQFDTVPQPHQLPYAEERSTVETLTFASAAFEPDGPLAAWGSEMDLYRTVVAPLCSQCHDAMDPSIVRFSPGFGTDVYTRNPVQDWPTFCQHNGGEIQAELVGANHATPPVLSPASECASAEESAVFVEFPTWSTVQPILEHNCASCHNAAGVGRSLPSLDFSTPSLAERNVKSVSGRIFRALTTETGGHDSAGTDSYVMPPGGHMACGDKQNLINYVSDPSMPHSMMGNAKFWYEGPFGAGPSVGGVIVDGRRFPSLKSYMMSVLAEADAPIGVGTSDQPATLGCAASAGGDEEVASAKCGNASSGRICNMDTQTCVSGCNTLLPPVDTGGVGCPVHSECGDVTAAPLPNAFGNPGSGDSVCIRCGRAGEPPCPISSSTIWPSAVVSNPSLSSYGCEPSTSTSETVLVNNGSMCVAGDGT